jgi:hypothetical protein
VGTHDRVAIMISWDFYEQYEYGSSSEDLSGLSNAYYASCTVLNVRNIIGSKTGLSSHAYGSFLAVSTLR